MTQTLSTNPYFELQDETGEPLQTRRLKYAAWINPAVYSIPRPKGMASFLPMEKVQTDGSIDLDLERSVEEGRNGFTRFQDGDVILAKITPCFENGKAAVCRNLTNGVGFGSTEFHVLRAKNGLVPEFLFYIVISDVFRAPALTEMRGVAGQQRVPAEYLQNYRHLIPVESVQRSIISFLDEKTSAIDTLIADKERFTELLREKRSALVFHVVTKGLDPNAPMKDSGVEWLGEIPEHWETAKIKYLFRMKSGESITSEDIEEEGPYPVYGGNGFRGYTKNFTHNGEHILIGRQGALCGNINYATGKFWASEHAVVVNIPDKINLRWAGELLRFMDLNRYSTAAAQPGLSVEKIQNLEIPVPPTEEVEFIASFIEQQTKDFEVLASNLQKSISLLREFRSTLITAAVTGQIDVREATIR